MDLREKLDGRSLYRRWDLEVGKILNGSGQVWGVIAFVVLIPALVLRDEVTRSLLQELIRVSLPFVLLGLSFGIMFAFRTADELPSLLRSEDYVDDEDIVVFADQLLREWFIGGCVLGLIVAAVLTLLISAVDILLIPIGLFLGWLFFGAPSLEVSQIEYLQGSDSGTDKEKTES